MDARTRLSREQRDELTSLADQARTLERFLNDAVQLGEKGHPTTLYALDASFKTLKQIVDRVKEFIKCL
jgi:hypothetical protein